jgi:hypothetical protein
MSDMLALSDLDELDCVITSLSIYVSEGTYSLNEVLNEIMPFEWNLASYEKDYVRQRVLENVGHLGVYEPE